MLIRSNWQTTSARLEQERQLERAGGSAAAERAFFLPTQADVYVAALHRWLQGHGGEPFLGQSLPARQSNRALMDRYDSHTRHCRSCSRALRWIRRARPWAWALLWAGAALSGVGQGGAITWIGLVLSAVAGLMLRQGSRWERGLVAGDGIAPRNRP